MKIVSRSPNGKLLKIGDDTKTAQWYHVPDDQRVSIQEKFKDGDDVTIEFASKANAKHLVSIVAGVSTAKPVEVKAPVVAKKVEQVKVGDLANPTVQSASKPATSLITAKPTSYVPTKPPANTTKTDTVNTSTRTYSNQGSETNRSIEKQVLIKTVAETLRSMDHHVTPDNVIGLIDKLANKYAEYLK